MINIFNNGSKKQLKLLKEILAIVKTLKPDDRATQLEQQMDSWLATLKTSIDKVEQVSGQVDSTK